MTIYRIHPDRRHYKVPMVPTEEVLRALGQVPFHIDPTPRSYEPIWKKLAVRFYDSTGTRTTKTPDISIDQVGRLFLSMKAFEVLKDWLNAENGEGEFLPVLLEGQEGYIFNPLISAEDVGGLDQARSLRNVHGDLQALSFHESDVEQFCTFKCEFEGFGGLFCGERFKHAVETVKLRGLRFSMDLGNIFPSDPTAHEPMKQ